MCDLVDQSDTDSDKSRLLNYKEDLNVFILNRAVCTAEVADYSKHILLEAKKILSLKSRTAGPDSVDEKVMNKVRNVKISTLSNLKLLDECETIFAEKYNAKKKENRFTVQNNASQTWVLLLKELRDWKLREKDLDIKSTHIFQNRMCEYERDLLLLKCKNQYRDSVYMAYYDLCEKFGFGPSQSEIQFFKSLNEEEKLLRSKIKNLEGKLSHDLTRDRHEKEEKQEKQEDKLKNKSIEETKKNKKVKGTRTSTAKVKSSKPEDHDTMQPFQTQTTQTKTARRSPVRCPGYGRRGIHEENYGTPLYCDPTDGVSRCEECHALSFANSGGRVQKKRKRE